MWSDVKAIGTRQMSFWSSLARPLMESDVWGPCHARGPTWDCQVRRQLYVSGWFCTRSRSRCVVVYALVYRCRARDGKEVIAVAGYAGQYAGRPDIGARKPAADCLLRPLPPRLTARTSSSARLFESPHSTPSYWTPSMPSLSSASRLLSIPHRSNRSPR